MKNYKFINIIPHCIISIVVISDIIQFTTKLIFTSLFDYFVIYTRLSYCYDIYTLFYQKYKPNPLVNYKIYINDYSK